MELKACILALRFIKKNYSGWKEKGINRLQIVTDSQYIYENKNRAFYWRKDKWRNRDGKPIENSDLWKDFLSLQNVNAEIAWHKGKTEDINKLVDRVAKEAARFPIKRKDLGFRPGKVSRSPVGRHVALPFPADGQSEIIRVYRYDLKGTGLNKEHKVSFSIYSLDTETLSSEKYYAYLKKKIDISRHQYYSVILGGTIKYPIIKTISEAEDL